MKSSTWLEKKLGKDPNWSSREGEHYGRKLEFEKQKERMFEFEKRAKTENTERLNVRVCKRE